MIYFLSRKMLDQYVMNMSSVISSSITNRLETLHTFNATIDHANVRG